MKQFFEAYTAIEFVPPLAAQLQKTENEVKLFVTTLLTQLQWSSHLLILSKTKTVEEKLFYLHLAIHDKFSVRDKSAGNYMNILI